MLLNEIKYKNPVEADEEYGMDAGRYIGMRFTPETKKLLKQIVHSERVPNPTPEDKLHSTVVYSKGNAVPDYEVQGKLNDPVEAEIEDFDYFDSDNGKCLVAKLRSDDMVARHNKAKDLGANYDYEEYKPHITLSYSADDLDDDFLDNLRSKYAGTKVYADEEYDEPIETDWAVKNADRLRK